MELSFKRISNYLPLMPFLQCNLLNNDVWLAGGALRAIIAGEAISDYDLFFRNGLVAAKTRVEIESLGAETIFKCPEGKLTTYMLHGMKIQCITENFYPSMEELIDTFDITACRYATDGTRFISTYSAVRDTLKRKINLHRVDFPVASMKRIAKYANKGYVMTSKAALFFTDLIYQRGQRNEELNTRIYID